MAVLRQLFLHLLKLGFQLGDLLLQLPILLSQILDLFILAHGLTLAAFLSFLN
jgi:hypothetical protein